MRILTTMLLVAVIGLGASFATRAADFDSIKEQLRSGTQPAPGSQAAPPTPRPYELP